MQDIVRKFIDWDKTGRNLKLLRSDDLNLRRYVCRELSRQGDRHHDCDGRNCDQCKYEMDHSISQAELARVFNVSDTVIANWEGHRSEPTLNDLLFYCQITGKDLMEIIIYQD